MATWGVAFMDKYIGTRRVRMTGVVADVAPGKKIIWRLRLLVSLSLKLTDGDGGVEVQHTIRAGFAGLGAIVDPLFRAQFAAATDRHVKTEFLCYASACRRHRRLAWPAASKPGPNPSPRDEPGPSLLTGQALPSRRWQPRYVGAPHQPGPTSLEVSV
jgi:hypothetical protein